MIETKKQMAISFRDIEHLMFFKNNVDRTGSESDTYRKAFFYTVGILPLTREHIDNLYDFESNCPRLEAIAETWQTDRTLQLCRLALNLYNGFRHSGTLWDDLEPDMNGNFTPYELFETPDAFFMLEAIKVRYPTYTRCKDAKITYIM